MEIKKKVGFTIEPTKWANLQKIAKANQSDSHKTLRILIDEYIKKNNKLLEQILKEEEN
ncbi:MAG: hypothetical protein U9N59_10510 [Campylobacterota bacterium]|nr:hypothetical protein [Campylobacterota bacterium]